MCIKKSSIVLLLLSIFNTSQAQQVEKKISAPEGGFKKENLFVGGDLTLGFSNGYSALGASPFFGYSINKYIDVAVSFNYIFTSQRDYKYYGDKLRQTVYGPGAFVRVYPLKFLFAQAQFEHNFIRVKYLPATNSGYLQSIDKVDANSLLVGLGYAGGRSENNKSFYYFSISWDLLKNTNSPYIDELRRGIPIIRAGYNIALFQGGSYYKR